MRFINDDATGLSQAYYEYDLRGNVTLCNVNTSPVTASNYHYDTYDRVTSVSHTLNGTTRTFNYGYGSDSDNRLWAKHGITPTSPENNKGEAFSYDLADQAMAFQLNVANPQNVSQPLPRNIVYDPNGNRTSFQAVQYGATNNSEPVHHPHRRHSRGLRFQGQHDYRPGWLDLYLRRAEPVAQCDEEWREHELQI